MNRELFPATVVGSMPRPAFVRELLTAERRAFLGEEAFGRQLDAAVGYVIAMMEAADLDIVSDGEWRRLSYIGVIADIARGFERTYRGGQSWHTVLEPLEVVAPGRVADEVRFLRSHTPKPVKVAVPSPYLLGRRMWDPERSKGAYPTRRDFMEALVPILREELIRARDAGAAIVQFDDPHLCLFVDPKVRAEFEDPDAEAMLCVELLNRIVEGVDGVKTALHLCRRNKGRAGWIGEGGYEAILFALRELRVNQLMLEFTIPVAGDVAVLAKLPERFEVGLGCVDCRSAHVDTPEEIVARVEKALDHVAPERILLVPDCGFAPGSTADIPIDEAFAKLKNEALAAQMLRARF